MSDHLIKSNISNGYIVVTNEHLIESNIMRTRDGPLSESLSLKLVSQCIPSLTY